MTVCSFPMIANTSTTMTGMFTYLNTATGTCIPGGGNVTALLLFIPLFFIMFAILTKQGTRPITAVATTCFVCLLVSFPMVALGWVMPEFLLLLLVLVAVGALLMYMEDRN